MIHSIKSTVLIYFSINRINNFYFNLTLVINITSDQHISIVRNDKSIIDISTNDTTVGEFHVMSVNSHQDRVMYTFINQYYQIGYVPTICTTGLSSFLMSVGKVSHCKQLHYFVAFCKHVACNAEYNCVTYSRKIVVSYKLHIVPLV
jgi:hypothetical protein